MNICTRIYLHQYAVEFFGKILANPNVNFTRGFLTSHIAKNSANHLDYDRKKSSCAYLRLAEKLKVKVLHFFLGAAKSTIWGNDQTNFQIALYIPNDVAIYVLYFLNLSNYRKYDILLHLRKKCKTLTLISQSGESICSWTFLYRNLDYFLGFLSYLTSQEFNVKFTLK